MTPVLVAITAAVLLSGLVGTGDLGRDTEDGAGPERARPERRAALGSPHGVRRETIALGRSARGRTIRVTAFGDSRAARRVLVVGCIHGTECAATAVVRRFAGCPPVGVDLWLLENLNPDGLALRRRVNGRGVDLNRNFGSGWRPIGRRWDPQHSGPRPWSEPETRIARRLIRTVRPDVTIWFHQQVVPPLVRAWGGSIPAARRFARAARLPFHALPWLAGTAPNWQNHRFPGSSSFVVELPFAPLGSADAVRYAAAIERLAGYVGENRRAATGARR
jgi:murein peptide amidase A